MIRFIHSRLDHFLIDMDPFSYLKDKKITDDENIRNLGASSYQTTKVLGIVGLVFTFMVCGIRLSIAQSGGKIKEVKERIFIECMIGIAISGFLFFAEQLF